VDEIVLVDQVGLDVFGVGEHLRKEFTDSSTAVVLAAAAAITKGYDAGTQEKSQINENDLTCMAACNWRICLVWFQTKTKSNLDHFLLSM
jgi:hypothetical protein